jgi:hypothetical protein
MIDCVLGECTEYSALVDLLRSYQPDDADLPRPLLAPIDFKSLTPRTLGPILHIKGLKLAVFVDDEQLAKIRHRLVRRKNRRSNAGSKNSRTRRRQFSLFRGDSEKARALRMAQLQTQSPHKRKAIARIAAAARWGKASQ